MMAIRAVYVEILSPTKYMLEPSKVAVDNNTSMGWGRETQKSSNNINNNWLRPL